MPPHGPPFNKCSPRIVATGFTTALLGDERTLREFVAGDHVVRSMRARGEPAILYLINDSYDPLNERQLRIGVKKDVGMIERMRPYCGQPIAEIHDPYGCHASYSEHFAAALTARLNALDIYPVVVDTYQAYKHGYYAEYVTQALEHHADIQTQLEAHFGYPPRSLFRVQCPECRHLDTTSITHIDHDVTYRCERCDVERTQSQAELCGKLNWKLDCAARWNLYGIGTEVFSQAHLAEMGTYNVSCFVSARWFGGHVPDIVKYGDLRLAPELCGTLMRILPPAALKQMMLHPLERDLHLTRASLEHFANVYEVRPGLSYARFVRDELPRKALEVRGEDWQVSGAAELSEHARPEQVLVDHGNAYSQFMHGRRHSLHHPNPALLHDASTQQIEWALHTVTVALAVRSQAHVDEEQLKRRLKERLNEQPMPGVYAFLRNVLGQEHGPHLTTLLAIVPLTYLVMVRTHLEAFADDRVNELRSPSEQEAAWRSRQHMQAAHLRAHPSTGTHS